MPARRWSNFVKFGWLVFEGMVPEYTYKFLVSQRWQANSRKAFEIYATFWRSVDPERSGARGFTLAISPIRAKTG
jgi:hypothetical protein